MDKVGLHSSDDEIRVVRLPLGRDINLWLENIRQFLNFSYKLSELPMLDNDLDAILSQNRLESRRASQIGAPCYNDDATIPFESVLKLDALKFTLDAVKQSISEVLPTYTSTIKLSETGIFLKNGYLGWRSYSTHPGGRVRCSWAQSSGKNFFRYYDPVSNSLITDWDDAGWNIRLFYIPSFPETFWSCAGAKDTGVSMIFRL